MYSKHYVHKTVFFMYLNDAQRDLICSAWTEVTVFTSITNTEECHVLWDATHKYKVAQKNNVWVEIAQNINAEVAQMKCRMQYLPVSEVWKRIYKRKSQIGTHDCLQHSYNPTINHCSMNSANTNNLANEGLSSHWMSSICTAVIIISSIISVNTIRFLAQSVWTHLSEESPVCIGMSSPDDRGSDMLVHITRLWVASL
jgi:hypothetical protein